MEKIMRLTLFIASLLLILSCLTVEANQQAIQKKARQIWLRTKAGPILNGDLLKMDSESVDFTVKGILQSIPCDDLIGVMFIPPSVKPLSVQNHSPPFESSPSPVVYNMSELKPVILYREAAAYTPKAKAEKIQGTVILQVVFSETGQITNINVIHGLPHGLNDQAISAARAIRFIPAMKDGRYVSVRGNLEFAFNLY